MILPHHTADQRARIRYILDVARGALAKNFIETVERGRLSHAIFIAVKNKQMSLEVRPLRDFNLEDELHAALSFEPRWGYIHCVIHDDDDMLHTAVGLSPADAVRDDPRRSDIIDVRAPADATTNAA